MSLCRYNLNRRGNKLDTNSLSVDKKEVTFFFASSNNLVVLQIKFLDGKTLFI